jgi:hypothetical protein
MSKELLQQRITHYLSAGGLFNPEMMKHDKVRDLLIECRDELAKREWVSIAVDEIPSLWGNADADLWLFAKSINAQLKERNT